MASIFHRMPEAMVGSTLHPLNELAGRAPEIWRRERAKYVGRGHVLELRVPLLECLWNDTLHFGTVHPTAIAAELEAAGIRPRSRRFYDVDPSSLDRTRAVVFLNDSRPFDEPSQWLPFEPDLLDRLSTPNDETRRYYRACAERGERPRLYAHLPHVLLRGSLDVTGVPVVEA